MGPAARRHPGPERRQRRHPQVAGHPDRARARRLAHPRLVVVHHRPRRLPRDPPRPPALPAQVHRAQGQGPPTPTARATSARTAASARASPTAAPPATGGRADPPGSAATSSRARTAATPRTCSASAWSRCWRTRSRPTCARSAPGRSPPRSRRAVRDPDAAAARASPTAPSPRARRHRGRLAGRRASTPTCASSRSSTRAGPFSIREFVVGALNAEMGLEAARPRPARRVPGRPRRHPVGHGPRRRTGQLVLRPRRLPGRTTTATASRTRSRPRSWTISSSICSTTSSPRSGSRPARRARSATP